MMACRVPACAPRGVARDTVAKRPLLRSFALDARGDSA